MALVVMGRELGEGLVFLILSHKTPHQVVRLAARIRCDLPHAIVIVHHDQSKSRLERTSLPAHGVDLIDDHVTAAWGTSSLVELTVRCLRYACDHYSDFAFAVLLSGQDYPLRHLGSLPAMLANSGDGLLPIEEPQLAEPLRYALAWYRLPAAFQNARVDALFARLIFHLNARQRIVRFASGRLGNCIGVRSPRGFPSTWRIFQGSQWWMLGRRAVDVFLRTIGERPAIYRRFLRRTIIPDEGIFQTILYNAPELALASHPDRAIRWDDRASGSPATFRAADFSALRASGFHFGRKFDAELDAEILTLLDAAAATDP